MLKTPIGDEVWMVQQPDHARVSAYLAAHWGGVNGFARPGGFAPFPEPDRLRDEVVAAIAEHDNGWLEWEAFPPIASDDGRPLSLREVGRQTPAEGVRRWRLGVPRFADDHPYVALLISLHATSLYAAEVKGDAFTDEQRHPLFSGRTEAARYTVDRKLAADFVAEQERLQGDLIARLERDEAWAPATHPAHLLPHLKLLQLADAMSLLLCFGGNEERELADIPRASWDDRVTLHWRPAGPRRIAISPYPFDTEPLPVSIPARVAPRIAEDRHAAPPLTRLHAIPIRMIDFVMAAG